jgi:thymidylate kinase
MPPLTGQQGRSSFNEQLARALDAADVDYVFLHGRAVETSEQSDVDIAVDRVGFETVDALFRMGVVGRLLQAFHYDIPWCWGYVVQGPSKDQRLVDVVCDPWSISRYGLATRIALSTASRIDGLRVPSTPATVLYLSVKRSFKGVRSSDRDRLIELYERDRDGARCLLEDALGIAGRSLAAALESRSSDLSSELASVRSAAEAAARTPRRLALRALFQSARIVERIVKPTGVAVGIVGPDGVGKSTTAAGLLAARQKVFARAVRLHGGTMLLPAPGRFVGRRSDTPDPHGRSSSGRFLSGLRLAYRSADELLSWGPKVLVPRARRSLVIIERGMLDAIVDPQRYRLGLTENTIRRVVALLPLPDIVVLLGAPPERIHSQKRELTVAEIARQLATWRSIAAEHPGRFTVVDASRSTEAIASEVYEAAVDLQASRQPDLTSCEVALKCLGRVSTEGVRYSVSRRSGRVRWLLPDGDHARGPWRSGLYRPATPRHVLGALRLELERALRHGGVSSHVRLDADDGLAPHLADLLGVNRVELAAALAVDSGRGDRALLTIRHEGTVRAFAKVAAGDASLEREQAILSAVRSATPTSFDVPEVLSLFHWQSFAVLVMRPIVTAGFADRALDDRELAAVVEIASLGEALGDLLGREPGLVPIHGDFAPWNCANTRGGLLLWDWESAGLGLPLEDVFHWRVQRLVLFGRGTPEGLAAAATEPDRQLRAICDQLELPLEAGRSGLYAYLERSLAQLQTRDVLDPAVRLRLRILDCLDAEPSTRPASRLHPR